MRYDNTVVGVIDTVRIKIHSTCPPSTATNFHVCLWAQVSSRINVISQVLMCVWVCA